MDIFGITLPWWYLPGCAVVLVGLAFYLVLDIARFKRRIEEADPDADFGVDDEAAVTQFFAVIRDESIEDPFAPDGSDAAWEKEFAALEQRCGVIIDDWRRQFDEAISLIGPMWARDVWMAEQDKASFLHRIGATEELPAIVDLIGAR